VKKNKAEDIVIPPPRPKRKAHTGRASTETSPPKRELSSTSDQDDESMSNTNAAPQSSGKQRSPRDTTPLTTTVDALKNQSYLLNPHSFAQWMVDNNLLTTDQSRALLEQVPNTSGTGTEQHERLLALNGVAESELHDLNSHVTSDRARDPVLAAEIERQRSQAKQFIELAIKQAGGPASGEGGAEHAGSTDQETRSVPHWAEIYSFLGSLFDQDQSRSDDRTLSSRFASMSSVDQQTVRVLMDNLLRVIHQPVFKDYHALLMQHYHAVVDQQHAWVRQYIYMVLFFCTEYFSL